jgi:hypothetical protein
MIRCGMNKICFLTPPDGQSFLCANPHVQAGTHPKRNVPRRGKHPPSYARHGAACRPGSCRAHYGGAWCAPFQAPGERRVSTPNFVEWRNIGPTPTARSKPLRCCTLREGYDWTMGPAGLPGSPCRGADRSMGISLGQECGGGTASRAHRPRRRGFRFAWGPCRCRSIGHSCCRANAHCSASASCWCTAIWPGLDAGSRPLRSGSGCDWPRLYRIPTSPQCATATE